MSALENTLRTNPQMCAFVLSSCLINYVFNGYSLCEAIRLSLRVLIDNQTTHRPQEYWIGRSS